MNNSERVDLKIIFFVGVFWDFYDDVEDECC